MDTEKPLDQQMADEDAEIIHDLELENEKLRAIIMTALERWQAWGKTDDNSWDELNDAFEELQDAYNPLDPQWIAGNAPN